MHKVTATASLQEALGALEGLTEIRDSHDKVIGYFSPAAFDEAAAVYAEAAAHFDVVEMKRRKALEETGLTTAEVLDRLKSLER